MQNFHLRKWHFFRWVANRNDGRRPHLSSLTVVNRLNKEWNCFALLLLVLNRHVRNAGSYFRRLISKESGHERIKGRQQLRR
jgi:hypothetical protein